MRSDDPILSSPVGAVACVVLDTDDDGDLIVDAVIDPATGRVAWRITPHTRTTS